jgi:hypothetical protein
MISVRCVRILKRNGWRERPSCVPVKILSQRGAYSVMGLIDRNAYLTMYFLLVPTPIDRFKSDLASSRKANTHLQPYTHCCRSTV